MAKLKEVTIHADGACSGNPGKGGYGAILLCDGKERRISGGSKKTTNNQMELTAAIEALKLLKYKCKVDLYTDSKYLVDGITEWVYRWQDSNWRTAGKKAVKNIELWQELLRLDNMHDITWHWVKGHNGDVYNELVDKIAKEAIKKL